MLATCGGKFFFRSKRPLERTLECVDKNPVPFVVDRTERQQ
jgi:hypothetical protein